MTKSLFDYTNEFRSRHNGPRQSDIEQMLATIDASSLDQLIADTVPKAIMHDKTLGLERAISESDYLKKIKNVALKNTVFKSYIGMGYYPCKVPSVILRNVLENPGWYTQYTPYQAEISQGRLEMLLNFQTMISDLTGMEISNSSLLDEGTAAAEAMTMAYRVKARSKKDSETIFISNRCHPQTIDVVQTRALPLGINVVIGDEQNLELTDDIYAILVQYPDTHGNAFDLSALSAKAKANDVLMIFATDLLALTMLKPPSELGADIVVGSAQRFGVPMGYGGPHAAYMATKDEYKRQIPGRLIGVSIDTEGKQAYRMALQTREQHIRREKATSNICTAQALLANMAAMYAIYHGAEGLKLIANRIHRLATLFAKHVKDLGFTVDTQSYFDTITVSGVNSKALRGLAEAAMVNLAYVADGQVSVSFHEQAQLEDVEELVQLFAKSARKTAKFSEENFEKAGFAASLKRTGDILVHDVFTMYRSETEMMRYLKRLENKDLSLTTSMIPLGSCTMKLNAATEMMPITWPEFGELHPFAPISQARGYHQLFVELETMLAKITKFSGVSLQPNSGAQGEYAGLLVIRKYHESRNDHARNLVLIPASAHGTNPASAVLAGMNVVVTKTDAFGNIDLNDLREKAEKHKDRLAALMVTYPSTHGVFEESIIELCKIIHDNGGQVYMDGANMNAQVGLTSPGFIGADVCHLNLHKTFCIPHGGGGPGMGPICVAEHLQPFLPSHPVVPVFTDRRQMGTISAAPWGSASILLISHAYISMMGEFGLIDATKLAILNANYIKARLEKHYPVLYKGVKGHVAHEMIFDCRQFKNSANIEVEDIAKRLMDYGFHAPTVSFPVAGTLMVEPTESESLAELDRFCDAMIGIREEIRRIENGQLDKEDNMLKHAPHTMTAVTQNDWAHPYSREEAAFPAAWLRNYKYWPATARVNNAHGDRELICTCPPIEMFED